MGGIRLLYTRKTQESNKDKDHENFGDQQGINERHLAAQTESGNFRYKHEFPFRRCITEVDYFIGFYKNNILFNML